MSTITPEVPSSGLLTTSAFYYLIIPTLALWYMYWNMSRKHFNQLAEKIPGPVGYPIIGNAFEFVGKAPGKNN